MDAETSQDSDDEGATSELVVDMGVRTQEKQQLEKFVKSVIERLEELGLTGSADELRDVTLAYDESDVDGFRYRAEATADEWRTVISQLSNEDGLDADWLRRKLARRLHGRVAELQEAVADG